MDVVLSGGLRSGERRVHVRAHRLQRILQAAAAAFRIYWVVALWKEEIGSASAGAGFEEVSAVRGSDHIESNIYLISNLP